jgi:hypothetical protein
MMLPQASVMGKVWQPSANSAVPSPLHLKRVEVGWSAYSPTHVSATATYVTSRDWLDNKDAIN